MAYVRVWQDGWKNHDTGGTPIDAESLNHMEDGIAENDAAIEEARNDIRELHENDDEVLTQSKRYSDERFNRMRDYVDEKTVGNSGNTDRSLQEFRDALSHKIDGAYIDDGYLYLTSVSGYTLGPYGPFAGNGSGGADIGELTAELNDIKSALSSYADDLEVTNSGLIYLLNNGNRIAGPYGPFTGGGGGSATGNVSYNVTNETGWISNTIASGTDCMIKISWYSVENNISTGDGSLQIAVGSSQTSLSVKTTMNVAQGIVSLNLAPYLSDGFNSVRVTVTDIYGNSRYVVFSVEVVSLALTSTFMPQIFSGSFIFPYTPIGSGDKTVHILVDNSEIGTVSTSYSNRQMSYTIPAQSHGAHTLDCYFTVELNGQSVSSNTLHYAVICVKDGAETPVIASDFTENSVAQYSTVRIEYTVYTPGSLTSDVIISVNNTEVSRRTVDRTAQIFSYQTNTTGSLTITIATGNIYKSFALTVETSGIEVDAETDSLSLYLTSAGRSNNEANPGTWTYDNISAQFDNFNFRSDGWMEDGKGNTVLRVTGDARVKIPYNLFAGDARSTGKTIEIEFATSSVSDYDAVIFSSLDINGRGISVTAQKATLKSEGTEIFTQYKEDEHVRIAFVIEKRNENRLVSIYINGIQSGADIYPATDNFSGNSDGIFIGSNECTIDLYNIRVYDNNLSRYQILNNYNADMQDVTEKIAFYKRNNVFDAYGEIVINQLPGNLPYMTIICPELPQYKGDKKKVDIIYVDPSDPLRGWKSTTAVVTLVSVVWTAVQANVQGTSSQGYPRKNYEISFKGPVTLADGTVLYAITFTESGKMSGTWPLREDAIPTDAFTLKADYASSEGANNVELVRLYNDTCPYKTPPQLLDSRVRQGIDGFPIVIFWQKTDENGQTVGNAVFIGKYNFNNDKGTPEVFGFSDGDESWEVKNNTSLRSLFRSADFVSTVTDEKSGKTSFAWLEDFEARYPEDNENAQNLQKFVAWVMSTNQDAVSGAEEKTARLQKFKNELSQYAEVDALIFYYLFTELFLMVDSRAKNAFWTAYRSKNGKWFSLPYDFDTALGINNEGALTFGYHLEDIDKTESGADVFNGQNSVLWVNLRQAFYSEIAEMYNTLRSSGAWSYEKVETMFEEHQNVWPEAVFNEDSYFKYIAPLAGGTNHLDMLQGAKTEQRKWWLYNRFRYIDSKYNAGDAQTDFISLRGYAKSDITVTPYADIYASVKYGQTLVQKRALRGGSQTLECPLDNVNDTEIYIYSASQLADVGDLSGLKVGQAIFSAATRIRRLKLGDASETYENGNLQTLTLGNNTLLKSLDVRNCNGLTGNIDVSGCINIEEIYFNGTNISGVTLPDGGILKKLYLPESITNLTILNQTRIEELSIPSFANVTTLRLENVGNILDSFSIVKNMPVNSRVRVLGVNWTATDGFELLEHLEELRGLDENGINTDTAVISGTLTVRQATQTSLNIFHSKYPNLTVTVISGGLIYHLVQFYNEDGSRLLYTAQVMHTGDPAVYAGESMNRPDDGGTVYTFAGWSTQPGSETADASISYVTGDMKVYAVYTTSIKMFTVVFRDDLMPDQILQTSRVQYGADAVYSAGSYRNPYFYAFTGWDKTLTNVTSDMVCHAQYSANETISDSWETIIANIENGSYRTKYHVGDSKLIDFGKTYGLAVAQIAAMDTDELADGSGTAAVTWVVVRHTINFASIMNPFDSSKSNVNGYGAVGGWEYCQMRNRLNEIMTSSEVREALGEISDRIKTVKKYANAWDVGERKPIFVRDKMTQDKFWIPSAREFFGAESILDYRGGYYFLEAKGPTYHDFFVNHTDVFTKGAYFGARGTIDDITGDLYMDMWSRSGASIDESDENASALYYSTRFVEIYNYISPPYYQELSDKIYSVCLGFCM